MMKLNCKHIIESNLFKFIVLVFLITLISFQNSNSSQKYLTQSKKEFIKEIQSNIYLDNFITAHIYADSLMANDSTDPIGVLFKAAVFISKMAYEEDDIYTDQFNKFIDSSMLLAEINIKKADSNIVAWNYLCIGHAYAYRSVYESRFGSLSSAIKNGFNAKSAYENGLDFDSSVYDLYGGLGMYHYWKSAKAGFLRWIHVFNDDKEKGIDELYLAIDSSEVSKEVAMSSLIWIYLDAKQYDTAIVIAQNMYNKYPDGNTFLWAMAKIYFQSAQYEKSIEVFQMLYDKLMRLHTNYFNIVESEHYIYLAYKQSNDKIKAHEIAKRFMYYVNKIPMNIRERQKEKINELVKEATR